MEGRSWWDVRKPGVNGEVDEEGEEEDVGVADIWLERDGYCRERLKWRKEVGRVEWRW